MHAFVYRLMTAGLAATISVAIAGSPAAAAPGNSGPASGQNVATIEREFLSGMIPHHRGAIDMAKMCLEKAVHAELRELCDMVIRDQNREKDLMAGYLQNWYRMEPPFGNMMPAEQMREMEPMLHGTMPDMMARMRGMEAKSGRDFEVDFMSSLIDHHSQAIMMATPVLVSAEHSELYPLAQQMVEAQGKEIEDLLKWLDEWYGVKRPM